MVLSLFPVIPGPNERALKDSLYPRYPFPPQLHHVGMLFINSLTIKKCESMILLINLYVVMYSTITYPLDTRYPMDTWWVRVYFLTRLAWWLWIFVKGLNTMSGWVLFYPNSTDPQPSLCVWLVWQSVFPIMWSRPCSVPAPHSNSHNFGFWGKIKAITCKLYSNLKVIQSDITPFASIT